MYLSILKIIISLTLITNCSQLQCCGNHRPRDWLDLDHPQPIPSSCCIKENCKTDKEDQIYSQVRKFLLFALYFKFLNHLLTNTVFIQSQNILLSNITEQLI